MEAGEARQTQALVMPQRLGRITGAGGDEAGSERRTILDRHRRALAHERVHRVASVAKQCRAADRPVRQRLAIEQRPDEASVGRGDDAPDLWVPALEGGEGTGDRGAVGPVLAVPAVVLGPANEIEEPPARAQD